MADIVSVSAINRSDPCVEVGEHNFDFSHYEIEVEIRKSSNQNILPETVKVFKQPVDFFFGQKQGDKILFSHRDLGVDGHVMLGFVFARDAPSVDQDTSLGLPTRLPSSMGLVLDSCQNDQMSDVEFQKFITVRGEIETCSTFPAPVFSDEPTEDLR